MIDGNPLVSIVDVAVGYYMRGFSLFPLWKGTKDRPLIQWKKYINVRPTIDEIKNWWSKYPDANIAIITGKVSGFFVLDTEKDFDLSSIQIPEHTPTVKTGSGGRHFYFAIPEGVEIGTHIEIWGSDPKSKADIKSNGGYVVAPPSTNEAKQSKYEWIEEIISLHEPPEWLLKTIENIGSTKSSLEFHEVAKGVGEGLRNVSASSFIGHVLLKTSPDMWEIVAWPAVQSWNLKNNPPMENSELRSVYESIANREFRRRDGVETIEDLKEYNGPDKVVSSYELQSILDVENENQYKYNSGLVELDRLCNGFVPGELIVISGPSKGGKTSLLRHLTTLFARQPLPVLWFTYEMTPRELLKSFSELPVFYLPMMNKTYDLKWLEKRIIEAKKKHGIKIVMIDHLEFILDAAQSQNLAVQLGTVVRYIKSIAREQELVIFLVHHIKKLEADTQPRKGDLRDSALVAAEADATVMVWRTRPPGKTKAKKDETEIFENDSMIKVCEHRRSGVVERAFRVKLENGAFIVNNYLAGEKESEISSSTIRSAIKRE